MTQEAIQKFIDEDINPALEMHGGYISIDEFDPVQNVLKIKMGGGCHGCASSQVTLKFQIETYLKEEFPDLQEIIDTTDHTAGENPFM
jgi:Fe/S biogenesis protein NfuA